MFKKTLFGKEVLPWLFNVVSEIFINALANTLTRKKSGGDRNPSANSS